MVGAVISTKMKTGRQSQRVNLQVFSKLVESALSAPARHLSTVHSAHTAYGSSHWPRNPLFLRTRSKNHGDVKTGSQIALVKFLIFFSSMLVQNTCLLRSKGIVQALSTQTASPRGSAERFRKTLNHHADICRRTRD